MVLLFQGIGIGIVVGFGIAKLIEFAGYMGSK